MPQKGRRQEGNGLGKKKGEGNECFLAQKNKNKKKTQRADVNNGAQKYLSRWEVPEGSDKEGQPKKNWTALTDA